MAAGTEISVLTFTLLAAGGMGLSTLHLGRKMRAWRSILNWRRSWLSREIILFSSFAGLSLIFLFLGGAMPVFQGLIAMLGFAALLAIDNVYLVTRSPRLRAHSAQALLTGALVLGLAGGFDPLFLGVASIKVVLYVFRKLTRPDKGALTLVLALLRVVPGALIPMWMWISLPPETYATTGSELLLVLGIALGEIIDRSEFDAEITVPTPRGQIAVDLEAALAKLHPG